MFELLFKYPRELFERGELVFSPIYSMDGAMLLLGATVLVVLSLFVPRRMRTLGLGRRAVLGLVQGLFAAAVLVLAARPAIEVATLAPGTNSVAVLVDVSQSMGFAADRDIARTRLDAAREIVETTLRPTLAGSTEVVTFAFGRSARRDVLRGAEASEPQTRLLSSLEDVLAGFQGTPLAAVVVLSDGADNGSEDLSMARLRSLGVPVHTIGVGPLSIPGEVQISDVVLQGDAPPDSRVVADVVLEHASTGAAAVKVFDGGRLIAVQAVNLARGTPTQRIAVPFDSGPGGIRQLSFAVEPPPGDALAGNNRLERLLTVRERYRRVLYLEGEPRWEYKFIRRALSGDEVVALTSWLRTTERKTYRQDVADADEISGGFPATRAELFEFDVVVLGSLAAPYLTDQQHQWLESFVADRGGSVLALAGRDALADGGWDVTPLANALPVRLTRQAGGTYQALEGRVRPTTLGSRSPITQLMDGEGADPWGSLPPLGDYQRLGATKPAATVLLEVMIDGRVQPLLVSQPYGLGSTAVLATATTWRWHMRTAADDPRHALFWRQLLRQLGESAQQPREVRFSVEDDAVELRLMERDENFSPRQNVRAEAIVTGPGADGQRLELAPSDTPGVLRGRYQPPQSGVYRIDVNVAGDDVPVTRFVRVGEQSPEYFQPAQNQGLLRRVADATGGRYWLPGDAGGIAEALTFTSSGVKRMEHFPVWDMPVAFLLLLVLKASEWLLRRHWGRI